jgi:hypothetical protein
MSRWKKTFLWALLAAVAVLLAPVLLTDRSAEGRITRQFPWEFHPEVGGAFIREELVIADCTFTITASHLAADESLIDGERLVLRLADVDGNAATAGNGFITLPLTAGRFATCAKVTDGRPCGNAERETVQLNLPRLRGSGKEEQYLGYVRALIAACQS